MKISKRIISKKLFQKELLFSVQQGVKQPEGSRLRRPFRRLFRRAHTEDEAAENQNENTSNQESVVYFPISDASLDQLSRFGLRNRELVSSDFS